MKTKILKKINSIIRIIENESGQFELQSKQFNRKEWITTATYNTFKQALTKKHATTVMIILRDLGHRTEFIKRRTFRKK